MTIFRSRIGLSNFVNKGLQLAAVGLFSRLQNFLDAVKLYLAVHLLKE